MNFNLSAFLKVAELVAGPALMAFGVPPILVPLAVHGIQLAESSTTSDGTPKSGAEKKAIALDAVATGIAGINAVKPGSVDPDMVKVVDEGIDAAVGAIHAVQKKPISVT